MDYMGESTMTGQPSFPSLHLLSLEWGGSARKVPLKDSQHRWQSEKQSLTKNERWTNRKTSIGSSRCLNLAKSFWMVHFSIPSSPKSEVIFVALPLKNFLVILTAPLIWTLKWRPWAGGSTACKSLKLLTEPWINMLYDGCKNLTA